MHHIRGALNLFFFLILISSIIFPAAYADDTTNMSVSIDSTILLNETINQSETLIITEPVPELTIVQNGTRDVIIEPTPETRIADVILPENAMNPVVNETNDPTLYGSPGLSTVTASATLQPMVTGTVLAKTTSLLATETPIPTQTEGTCSSGLSESAAVCSNSEFNYPLMHMSKAQLDEEEDQFRTIDKYTAPKKARSYSVDSIVTSKSLLSYISYVPAERNQG